MKEGQQQHHTSNKKSTTFRSQMIVSQSNKLMSINRSTNHKNDDTDNQNIRNSEFNSTWCQSNLQQLLNCHFIPWLMSNQNIYKQVIHAINNKQYSKQLTQIMQQMNSNLQFKLTKKYKNKASLLILLNDLFLEIIITQNTSSIEDIVSTLQSLISNSWIITIQSIFQQHRWSLLVTFIKYYVINLHNYRKNILIILNNLFLRYSESQTIQLSIRKSIEATKKHHNAFLMNQIHDKMIVFSITRSIIQRKQQCFINNHQTKSHVIYGEYPCIGKHTFSVNCLYFSQQMYIGIAWSNELTSNLSYKFNQKQIGLKITSQSNIFLSSSLNNNSTAKTIKQEYNTWEINSQINHINIIMEINYQMGIISYSTDHNLFTNLVICVDISPYQLVYPMITLCKGCKWTVQRLN